MKKNVISFLIIILCLLVITVFIPVNSKKPSIYSFNLSEYQWIMENAPSNKNVGPIKDAEDAVNKAKDLWMKKFGMINGVPHDPIGEEPIRIAYDIENKCWLLNATRPDTPNDVYDAAPQVLIQDDGTVLATWYG